MESAPHVSAPVFVRDVREGFVTPVRVRVPRFEGVGARLCVVAGRDVEAHDERLVADALRGRPVVGLGPPQAAVGLCVVGVGFVGRVHPRRVAVERDEVGVPCEALVAGGVVFDVVEPAAPRPRFDVLEVVDAAGPLLLVGALPFRGGVEEKVERVDGRGGLPGIRPGAGTNIRRQNTRIRLPVSVVLMRMLLAC
jgi:hypothetical protein